MCILCIRYGSEYEHRSFKCMNHTPRLWSPEHSNQGTVCLSGLCPCWSAEEDQEVGRLTAADRGAVLAPATQRHQCTSARRLSSLAGCRSWGGDSYHETSQAVIKPSTAFQNTTPMITLTSPLR